MQALLLIQTCRACIMVGGRTCLQWSDCWRRERCVRAGVCAVCPAQSEESVLWVRRTTAWCLCDRSICSLALSSAGGSCCGLMLCGF